MTMQVEYLDEGSALSLMACVSTGRVIYTIAAMPAVWPLPFRLDPEAGVVLRTDARSGLAESVDGTLVAFEADELTGPDGAGWCVTLLGRAVVALADGHAEIHILPEVVHGRRLGPNGS
ncbi:hypothetical protein ABIA32_003222 [Streptacidiphilus sp. MAP12-20]|uniref:pyridoxamine 5'-phosphate oxidase family protein n=1 Tax=Streptacidiphilus sp. MAP12-20 TaxID=3156299 RepID=UPI0035136F17